MTRSWCTPLSISLAYVYLRYIYWDTFIEVEFLGQFTGTIWKFLTHVAQLPSKWLLFTFPDSVPGSRKTHQLLTINCRSITEKQMEPAPGPIPTRGLSQVHEAATRFSVFAILLSLRTSLSSLQALPYSYLFKIAHGPVSLVVKDPWISR